MDACMRAMVWCDGGAFAVGMGPDLSLMASTPAPGEVCGEDERPVSPEQPQNSSPLKAVTSSQPRPTSASSSKSAPKSPLSVGSARHSDAFAKPKDVRDNGSAALTYTSLNSGASFPATEHGGALTRSNSQVSNTTEASDGTVIVHKEGSGSAFTTAEHARRALRDTARQAAARPVQQSPTSNGSCLLYTSPSPRD